MNCPRAKCNSLDTKIRKTTKRDRLPREFAGKNLTRRFYTCLECGKNFFTIEILEDLYQDLITPIGRLETERIQVGRR